MKIITLNLVHGNIPLSNPHLHGEAQTLMNIFNDHYKPRNQPNVTLGKILSLPLFWDLAMLANAQMQGMGKPIIKKKDRLKFYNPVKKEIFNIAEAKRYTSVVFPLRRFSYQSNTTMHAILLVHIASVLSPKLHLEVLHGTLENSLFSAEV